MDFNCTNCTNCTNYFRSPEAPGQPQSLTIDDVSPDHVTLSWHAPASDGGTPVRAYVVKQRKADDKRGDYSTVCEINATENCLSHTARELAPDSGYEFMVVARNDVGDGQALMTQKAVVTKPRVSKYCGTYSCWYKLCYYF